MNFYTHVSSAGKYVYLRGIEDGRKVQRKVDYMPSLFTPTRHKSKYKTIHGEYVEKKTFDDIKQAREYIKNYKDVDGFRYYGMDDYIYPYISDNYGTIEFDEYKKSKLKIGFLDIEVESKGGFPHPDVAKERINAIGIKVNGITYIFGLEHDYTPKTDEVEYRKYNTEVELLTGFNRWWNDTNFDVITGWNVDSFDITYIINRSINLMGEEFARTFSPWNWIKKKTINKRGMVYTQYELVGIAVIDYLDIYCKSPAIPERENYKLDFIASVELGEKKLSYEEYGNLHNLYMENWELFIDYNIQDVALVERLDDKLKLLDLTLTMAYDAGINYIDVASQTKSWDVMIYNELKSRNMVVPPRNRNPVGGGYAGAYVKDPIVGFHEWIVSFDLASLYPHLIMQYNISPETIVGFMDGIDVDTLLEGNFDRSDLIVKNLSLCPSGNTFDNSKLGILPEMMDRLYKERKKFKKLMLKAEQEREKVKKGSDEYARLTNEISKFDNIQLSRKISLNSAYGAIGFQYFRYYDTRIAESITLAGQLSIRWIEKTFNEYFNKILKTDDYDYVVAIDTDSNYLRLGKLVDQVFDKETQKNDPNKVVRFLDKVASDKIEPMIAKSYENLAKYMNAYDQKMFMDREAIANKGIWTAKKRYILNVFNNEGVQYSEPKLKIMGIESVRSSTPAPVRDYLESSFKIIINETEDDMIKYIADKHDEFISMRPEDVASPTTANNMEKWGDTANIWKSGCPKHIKGALVYNKVVHDKGLDKKFKPIASGEKVKMMPLKEPNPLFSNAVTFADVVPDEFGLSKYLNYEEQWEKTYISPLKKILDVIGWETEHKSSLDSFFG